MAGQNGASEGSTRQGGLYPLISVSDLERLRALAHHDPHSVLGAHPVRGGVIVRAFRPEAETVELLIGDDGPREMVKALGDDLFELLIEDRAETFPYRLRVTYAGGKAYTLRDPYSFLPTLDNFDEHLFGEGRHE
jgi:1,4-alpha-glucan branching enzyme